MEGPSNEGSETALLEATGSYEAPQRQNSQLARSDVIIHADRTISPGVLSSVNRKLSHGMRVCVRLMPYPREMKVAQGSTYYILDQRTLGYNIQKSDSSRSQGKTVEVVGMKFMYSHSFAPTMPQGMVFEHVVKPELEKFFQGNNCTVMAYGGRSSGKTYTLEGSFSNPGLIPRTLQNIFFLKEPKTFPSYKPTENNAVEALNEIESALEIAMKNRILSSLTENNGDDGDSCSEALKRMKEQLRLAPSEPTEAQHEVWVSYVEIRDETFYDLLSPEYNQHDPLKLDTDDKDNVFVKGLSYLPVESAADAWDLLVLGRNNLKKFNAMWNTRSSKSHCIFSIILLKYYEESRPENIQMSRFSFCDLAGQESPNIDTSLLSLTKSLKAATDDQLSASMKSAEYFCQSKLTLLFRKAVMGQEFLSIVVNVNPLMSMSKETLIVLHSTALATEVVTKIKKIHSPEFFTKFGQILMENSEDWDDLSPDKLVEISETFHNQLGALKALSLRTVIQAHEKMINQYTKLIERISNVREQRLLSNPKEKRKTKKGKSGREKLSKFQDTEDDSSPQIDQLKHSSQKLRTQKQLIQRKLSQLQLQLNSLLADIDVNNVESIMLNQDLTLIVCDQTWELRNKEKRIKDLTELLNQAKMEITKILNESREKDRKLCEIEKKYEIIKFDRDNYFAQQRNTNYSFKVQREMLEILESKLERERELRHLFQGKYEELRDAKEVVSPVRKVESVDRSTLTDVSLTDIDVQLTESLTKIPGHCGESRTLDDESGESCEVNGITDGAKVNNEACTSCPKVRADEDSSIVDTNDNSIVGLRRSQRKRRWLVNNFRRFLMKRSRSDSAGMGAITCDNCGDVIIDVSRYHCSVCSDNDFDLCSECYKKIGHQHEVPSVEGDD